MKPNSVCVCVGGGFSWFAGWLLLEVRGSWIKQRRYWFVLSQDSLDYYSGSEKGARRLGTLVLTSLCSVIWPDKQKYKETGEDTDARSRRMKRAWDIAHLRVTSLVTGLTRVKTLCGEAQVSGLRGELFLFSRSINNII